MRTLETIQQQIIDTLASNNIVVSNNMFSRRRLWTYVVAFSIFTLEKLFDVFKTEINLTIENLKPGTRDWYKQMVLNFQYGHNLIIDSDEYDNSGFTQQQIDSSKIVKYCAVTDKGDILSIKVATSSGTELEPLSNAQLLALQAYIQKIKYGGVFISLVNETADSIKFSATIFYNPMLIDGNGVDNLSGVAIVKNAIENHLRTLSFNGVFSTQALIDDLQKVEGVVYATPSLVEVKSSVAAAYEEVETYYIPASGYLRFVSPTHLNLTFIPYAN